MPPTREEALAQLPTGITLQMSATEKPKGPPRSTGRTWTPSTAPPGWRSLAPHEIARLRPKTIQNSQGVEDWERWVFKNLASSAERGKAFLADRGYHVLDYGPVGSFNAAVQKVHYDDQTGEQLPPDPAQWKVVDPSGFEFGRDLLDLTADIVHGAVTNAVTVAGAASGASLGPAGLAAGGVAGSVAGGIASETALQSLGAFAGVPENVDLGQIATVGALSGAGQALLPGAARFLGRVAKAGAKKVGGAAKEVASEIGSRIAVQGQSSGSALTNQAALNIRAKTMPLILPSLEDAKSVTLGLVERLRRSPTAMRENRIVDAFLGSATRSRAKVDVLPAIQKLHRLEQSILTEVADPGSARQARRVIKEIVDELDRVTGPGGTATVTQRGMMDEPIKAMKGIALPTLAERVAGGPIQVPVKTAYTIKQSLQKLSKFDRSKALPSFASTARKAQYDVRMVLERVLGPKYADASRVLSEKLDTLGWVEDHLRKESGESFVNGLFSEAKGEARTYIGRLDDIFGSDINSLWSEAAINTPAEELVSRGLMPNRVYDLARYAKVGTKFSREGAPTMPGLIPRFTAAGMLLGPSLVGGYVADDWSGVPVGAAAGLGAAALASPRGIVGLTRAAQRMGPSMARAAGTAGGAMTSPGASAAARTAMQAALRDYAKSSDLFPTNKKTHKPVVRLR